MDLVQLLPMMLDRAQAFEKMMRDNPGLTYEQAGANLVAEYAPLLAAAPDQVRDLARGVARALLERL